MSAKLLTEHHLEFLRLTGGCTGSSESTLVKMPHCWKSHVAAQYYVKIDRRYLPISFNICFSAHFWITKITYVLVGKYESYFYYAHLTIDP